MKHRTPPRFWRAYEALPAEIRKLADKNFELLKSDPTHSSLYFRKVGKFWSARVGRQYRALAVPSEEGYTWVSGSVTTKPMRDSLANMALSADTPLRGGAMHFDYGRRRATQGTWRSGTGPSSTQGSQKRHWRVTFKFVGKDADSIDYEDYHKS